MKRSLSCALVVSILVSVVGPETARAAQNAGVRSAGVPVLPAIVAPSLNVAPSLGSAPVLPPVIVPAIVPTVAVPAPLSPAQQLQTGVQALEAARNDDGRRQALEQTFTGARAANPGETSVPGAEGAASGTGLSPASSEAFEEAAIASVQPLATRLKALARVTDQAALRRVAAANPEGGAEDYEVHRAALRALADQGVVLSLRPVSRAHADQILAGLAAKKPETAVFDYDDTLAKFRENVSPEIAAGLAAAAEEGVDTVILTDRPDVKKSEKDATIMASLETMTPAQKANLTVGSKSGQRLNIFGKDGAPVLFHEENVSFSEPERSAIAAASARVAEKFGAYSYNGKTDSLDVFSWVRFLAPGTGEAVVKQAEAQMQAELDAAGVKVQVSGRVPADPANPAYLSISKIDKSVGMATIRASRDLRSRMQAGLRFGLRGKALAFARRIYGRVKTAPTSPSSMVVVGDAFFGTRTVDSPMSKSAPGALTLAVGGEADPRLDNAFVWPTKGREASLEILGALGKKPADAVNKTMAVSLFVQRTLGIAAFIAISIAYPFAAVPVVGWTGYGILMALSPMAGIAAAPVGGIINDMFGARTVMILNTLSRAALLLFLPAFWYFGVLNFGTLLLAALADGWLISQIMTSEGALIPRLFPSRHVGTINAAFYINYLALQVVLGLILGLGHIVDKWNPFAVFFGASMISLINVAIIAFTIPNVMPPAKNAAAASAPAAPKVPFLKKYWKEALVFVAAVGLNVAVRAPASVAAIAAAVPFLASFPLAAVGTLALSGALVFWISRTDNFRAVWSGAFAAPSGEARVSEDNTKLRKGMSLLALSALLMYPLQYFLLPQLAIALVGEAAKGLVLGRFLGALFFGNMIATAANAKMPAVNVPLLGPVEIQRFIQAGVVGLAALWAGAVLFPGSIVAALAAAAIAAGLINYAQRPTARGWVRMLGVGFAAIWLPFLAWIGALPFLSVPLAMSIGLVAIGMAYGPIYVSLITYLMRNTVNGRQGQVTGANGGIFNAAISVGYALTTIVAALLPAAFPWLFAVLGVAYAIGGLTFWRAGGKLPAGKGGEKDGLPADLFKK